MTQAVAKLSNVRKAQRTTFWAGFRSWCANFQRRRQFKKMLNMDDRMLADIGLTREEVFWGAGLPLDENASLLVHHKARVRRRHEARITLNP